MNMSGHRRKVAELIHQKLALMLPRLLHGNVGLVTLIGVTLSADETEARVQYSVLGDDRQQSAAAEALEEAAPRLRQQLGRVLRIRRIPELVFVKQTDMVPGSPPDDR